MSKPKITSQYIQGYCFHELSSRLFLNAQHPMEYTIMRKTRKMMLITATLFQSLLMLSSIPALHDWQLQHKIFGSLLQAKQSGLVKDEVGVPVQFVGLMYWKLQSLDGLQQPDCEKNVYGLSNKHIRLIITKEESILKR